MRKIVLAAAVAGAALTLAACQKTETEAPAEDSMMTEEATEAPTDAATDMATDAATDAATEAPTDAASSEAPAAE